MAGGVSTGFQTVAVISIGCRTNQEEMVSLQSRLTGAGYKLVSDNDPADIVIVNTCSVTALTESKTKRLIDSVHRQMPRARILVTGCLAQQAPSEIHKLGGVCWVVGNTCKDRITDILSGDGGVFHTKFDTTAAPALRADPPQTLESSGNFRRTRFAVKIQEGCDFRCSYCIVPALRGPSHCADCDSVLEACRGAIDQGYKEIILTGTHIGQYHGCQGGISGLIEAMLRIDGDFRIRLSSLDPRDLTEEIVELAGTDRRVCDHLHVSLQSLSPKVLHLMNRPYRDIEQRISLLTSFRRAFPRAGLGADFIVGFPGETDADFDQTVQTFSSIGFSYAHIFRYSKRPGTDASAMDNQVMESVKKTRSDVLRRAAASSRQSFIEAQKNVRGRIIVESENPVRGMTSNYLHTEISGAAAPCAGVLRNEWMDVCLTGTVRGRYCRAENYLISNI